MGASQSLLSSQSSWSRILAVMTIGVAHPNVEFDDNIERRVGVVVID